MSVTFAEALVVNLPELVDEQAIRAQNRARFLKQQQRADLLRQIIDVGPVGRDTVAYIRRHKPRGNQTSQQRDLAALLSVREWTDTVRDPNARFVLLQQQRRVANMLGIRPEWEEAVR